MTRVIHTGDTHIGYQQYHTAERREDFLAAFRQVVDDAVAADVDAVIHAGDLFHDRRPDLQDLLGTLSVLRTLDDADIPFLAIVGNHEGKRNGQWLDLYENLGLATRLGSDPYVLGNTAFYGLDFVPPSRRDQLDYEFAPHDADHAALVTHGLFTPFDFGDWDTEGLLETASIEFDAMLLGDNHKPAKKQVGETWVTYCGSTERASASERDERGYNIVTFENGVDITRRGLPTRQFHFIDIELGDGEGLDEMRARVREYDLDDAVALVTITGDGEPFSQAAVEEFATERGALVARVTDKREYETPETEVSVSFADPDEAVRERVRELGLSGAAIEIDEVVRASKVADSNVRDEVETRVRELLDGDDISVFTAAPRPEHAETEAADTETDTEKTVESTTQKATTESPESAPETADAADEADTESADAVAGTDDDTATEIASETDPEGEPVRDEATTADEAEDGEKEDAAEDAAEPADESADATSESSSGGQTQRSMEEYL
ncbi:DNA double-strand break repair protein Mre11 [Haladaptatus sp. YSMS36]|uniref:DNA double-strand break repair protein Mre11 n=1 Tax=Haladaptatus sp. YSMS36 TaxID=3033384 RepID=UPI0023E7A467|nr:DNA double-strand break repair protein Mre11 [Haladaptatus sp. YSMS36]